MTIDAVIYGETPKARIEPFESASPDSKFMSEKNVTAPPASAVFCLIAPDKLKPGQTGAHPTRKRMRSPNVMRIFFLSSLTLKAFARVLNISLRLFHFILHVFCTKLNENTNLLAGYCSSKTIFPPAFSIFSTADFVAFAA